ncbi:MAG: SEL1-like repeat protein [Muribaculaceae bacterium]|nr:SEL1-like repeat protein [Muribaculaceae bacterium]
MKKALLIAIALMIMTPSWAQSWSKDLEKKAKSGDVAAQVTVGNTYLNGDGVEKNLKKATKWFYLAAKAGNKEAENALLSFHSKELEKYAKEGNAEAQFCVGEFYYNGTDVEKDLKKAAQWYDMAVAQEHEKARTKLLSFYSKELEKLAKSGDAQAQYEVGMDYLEGNGVKKNSETAAKWLNLAQTQGHKKARTKLLSFYSKELEKLAKNGDAQAQYEVGMDYLEGNGVKKSSETAAKWFYKAKLQGHEDAKIKYYSFFSKYLESNASKDLESLYTVGSFYFDGNGVDKNEKKGFKYLKKAYESGHPLAMDKMGTRYTKSLKKMALTWYSSIKNTDATYQLACCYFYGRGVPVDKGYAISVLSTLSQMGHEKSKDLFYSIDCPERNSRATTYVINKTLKINGYSDWNGLSLSDNLGKTMTVKRNVITSEEKNFINSLDHPNKTEFISVDLGDMSYFVGNTTIDNHDYYVTYQGVLLFIPQEHSNYQNNNNINNSDVIFCKGGTFKLFKQGDPNHLMTTSIDSYMCGNAPYKGTTSTTSIIPHLTSINGIDVIPQDNVKKTTTQILNLPLNEYSYQETIVR